MDKYQEKLLKENNLLEEKIKELQSANQKLVTKIEEIHKERDLEKEEYKSKIDKRDLLETIVSQGNLHKSQRANEWDRYIKHKT